MKLINIKKMSNEEKEDFFESAQFKQLMGIIQSQKKVSGMSLDAGSQEVPGLSFEDFNRVCYSLYHNYAERVEIDEDEWCYVTEELEYGGYQFSCMVASEDSVWFHCDKIND
jgi:hypothetical protein